MTRQKLGSIGLVLGMVGISFVCMVSVIEYWRHCGGCTVAWKAADEAVGREMQRRTMKTSRFVFAQTTSSDEARTSARDMLWMLEVLFRVGRDDLVDDLLDLIPGEEQASVGSLLLDRCPWPTVLTRLLKNKNSEIRHLALDGIKKYVIENPGDPARGLFLECAASCVSDPDASVRGTAGEVIAFYGPEDPVLFDAVVKLSVDPEADVRQRAAVLLGQLYNDDVVLRPLFLVLLEDVDPGVRWSAVLGLESLVSSSPLLEKEAEAAEVAVLLTRRLKDGELDVRKASVVALGKMGRYAAEHVDQIAELVRDEREREDVRWLAVEALAELGEVATPYLVEMLADSHDSVHNSARVGLSRRGPGVIPSLVAALGCDNPRVVSGAAGALGDLGTAAECSVPSLIGLLKDDSRDVRVAACHALGDVSGTSSAEDAVIAALLGLVETDSDEVVEAGLSALGRLPVRAHHVVVIPAIVKKLYQRGATVPVLLQAIRALAVLAERDAAAAKGIETFLGHESSRVRYVAADCLWRLAKRAELVIPVLSERLRNGDFGVLNGRPLQEIGTRGRELSPLLLPLIENGSPQSRVAAARALWRVSQENEESIVKNLVGLLAYAADTPGGRLLQEVMGILTEMGRAGRPGLRDLREFLSSRGQLLDEEARESVIRAIRAIQEDRADRR
jgi:HEAT repeat protein